MVIGNLKVPVKEAVNQLVLNVEITGVNAWRIRLWIGMQFLKLAAATIGCGIYISEKKKPRTAAKKTRRKP